MEAIDALYEAVHSLVMLRRVFKLAEEYVRVGQVAVGAPLRRLVVELARDPQPLRVVADRARELPEKVARVAEVPARATHGLPVFQASHQFEVLPGTYNTRVKQWLYLMCQKYFYILELSVYTNQLYNKLNEPLIQLLWLIY